VEPIGLTNLVSVKLGQNELKSVSPLAPALQEKVSLSFSLPNVFFFDAQSGFPLRGQPA